MKWYNKPITWKGYGILRLAVFVLAGLNVVAMLLKPSVFLKPYERFLEIAEKCLKKFN